MKSRTIEIIDNHIKALEEELEWYQAKNREWQEESDKWIEKTEWIQQEADGGRFAGYHRADVIKTLFDELRAKLSERRYTGIRIDGTWLDFVELQQENARLREQLRWHSVDEFPPIDDKFEIKTLSVDVLLKRPSYKTVIAWHLRDRNEWWAYDKGKIPVPLDSKWRYIPEDGDA